MKDLYKALGITPAASAQEIKRAYRRLALNYHPDRGGDGEMMRLLVEAYDTLSDSDKRRNFDANWGAFQEVDTDADFPIVTEGYLHAGNTLPYSHTFREQHKTLAVQYQQSPLMQKQEDVSLFESGIYRFKERGVVKQYHDIFTFIRALSADSIENKASTPKESLTPTIAVKLFMDFLSGNYFGAELITLSAYLASEIRKRGTQAAEKLLYQGIFEIVLMTEKTAINPHNLIASLKKITDFANAASNLLLPSLIPLFYNKFFRNLYAYALTLYWHTNENLFDAKKLNQFDGYQEANELLNVLKERLSSSSGSEGLSKLIRYLKLLRSFENDLHEPNILATADEYRETAFHLLDWIPTFIERSSRQILVNIFLQIGIKFQQASQLETRLALKMADESLALKMYLTAVGIGHHSTPDVEIYVNTHVLKYISVFQFQDSILNEVIPALKKKALILADVFPFFENPQSNVTFLRQENKMLHLMRHLLNAMMEIHEYNKAHSEGIVIDHSAVTILYQAYEACLKNWYQEEHDPLLEKKFRLELMDELLFDNGWTFFDVEQRLDSPWIMVDRDEQGWMKPTSSLPYTEDKKIVKYRTINGAEVNHKTGEINFFMVPWNEDRSPYEKVLTLFDLQEMLEKNIGGAIFSLDLIDPDKPYHPFNLMRFSPAQLFESELLNTMLLTDYILKFLTTNQEVQGQYPFDQRPVASMIKHLPEYLRQIIDDFQNAPHSGAVHRFWIEAEEIDISVSDKEERKNDITRIGLGNLTMTVKKHRMERDINGELQDVGNEDEGWPIYVLTPEQMQELKQGTRVIAGHAMVFIYAETKLFYWEDNAILHAHVPQNYRETLIRLYKQPKDEEGKVAQNSQNRRLRYRVTKDMAQQSGLSHRYSPEFIFAYEFTIHYDEFAMYLPEFERLKELSKISSLIRLLSGLRQSNQDALQALNFILSASPSTASAPDTDTYRDYEKNRLKTYENITTLFQELRQKVSSSALQRKWREELNRIKDQMGTLTFHSFYSPEIDEACQRWYDELAESNPDVPSERIWREIITPKRREMAKKFSESKQKSCRSQLYDLFSSQLLSSVGSRTYGKLIDSFIMQENINPLADALINYEKTQAQRDISKQFPSSSPKEIALALDDNGSEAAKRIANAEIRCQLKQQKDLKDKLEAGFVQINLAKHEEPKNDLQGECLWVPASVQHEVHKEDTSGLSRYSFFVYGGVNLQSRINVVQGRNAPLGGNRVGGGAFNRAEIRKGFQSHHIISPTNTATKNHRLLNLAGVNNTKDMNAQPNRILLPSREGLHPTRSLHSGRHTQAAMNDVAREMDRIVATGKIQNWSQSQYRAELRSMLAECRQGLRAGTTNLYAKQPTFSK